MVSNIGVEMQERVFNQTANATAPHRTWTKERYALSCAVDRMDEDVHGVMRPIILAVNQQIAASNSH